MDSARARFDRSLIAIAILVWAICGVARAQPTADKAEHRYLYVACPGIRDYLEFGGHGLLVFDIDQGYEFVKRIATAGVDEKGRPLNVKGVCASAATGRLYISTIRHLMCLDLADEKILWEQKYDAGCDRMAITPDGATIYLPTLEGPYWYVVDAKDGSVERRIVTDSGAHNTICGLSGRFAYLAGLKSPLLRLVDTDDFEVRTVGPFSASIRPFTVDGRERHCYVNVNDLLGFEAGDLQTGQTLYRVVVDGFQKGPTKRHGCPSHGIALSPDEREVWLADAANSRVHIFDITAVPPKQLASVSLREQPGWIGFRLDGRHVWPSTGEVIDAASRRIVAALTDEESRQVHSEKMIEVHLRAGRVVRVGDQFGLGRQQVAAK
jgi:hypothetical protein